MDIFLWSIFRLPVFTSVFFLIQMILNLYLTHIWPCVDLFFALLLDIWRFCFGFFVVRVKKKKTRTSSLFQEKVIFFESLIFNHFYDSHCYLKNDTYHIDKVYNIYVLKVIEKVQKMMLKWELAKWINNIFCCFFSTACSILELMLCNRNLKILVYWTLLGSYSRTWALKFIEH